MSKLLKKYSEIESKFLSDKERQRYSTLQEWSKAYNEEKEKVLAQMSENELLQLLERTSGMYKIVIQEYLNKKVQNKWQQELLATCN